MRTNQKQIAILICLGLLVAVAGPASAQKKGQSAKISHGVVVGVEQVDLKDSKATQGALVGGGLALAYASGSGKSSKERRRRTATGALVGAGIGAAASKTEMGMLYTVQVAGGAIQVVTDQTEIHMNDCVVVEETSKGANIRRVNPEVCDPASAEVVEELQEEFQEEAAECAAARAEVAAAETDEQLDRAMRKVSILCN